MLRKRIFEIIEKPSEKDTLSLAYDYFMIAVILVSFIPLAFKTETPLFSLINRLTVIVFGIDYLLRWMTADLKFNQHGILPFLKYPFTPMAIVDLIAILSSFPFVNNGFRLLRMVRMIHSLRVLRVFKAMRYSRSFEIICRVLETSKDSLSAVCALAGGYILISALLIFNLEPNSFPNFFEAVYWAAGSLTAVGFGNIHPVSIAGKIVTILSSVFGIAIVALPAGIITAGYMTEISQEGSETEKPDEDPH